MRRYSIVSDEYKFTTIYCLGEALTEISEEWLKDYVKLNGFEDKMTILIVDVDERNKVVNYAIKNKMNEIGVKLKGDKESIFEKIVLKVVLLSIQGLVKLGTCRIEHLEENDLYGMRLQ